MKILHTSDWHLGQKLYEYDRKDEQFHFLEQIAEIVLNEKPDVMIVSGDIFHVATPNIETQTMFVDGLLNIHNQCDTMTIIVTAGNHDSYSRLEIDKKLWNRLNVHVVGNISKNVEEHLINIAGKGWVAALPYCSGRNFPQLLDDNSSDNQALYFNALQEKARELNTENLPVILSAHLAANGCDIKGHDKTQSPDGQEFIGGIEYTNVSVLGDYYDYIALGHIHHPQYVGNGNRIRYSGTPMAITFNEEYEHSVTIIEIDKHNGEQKHNIININQLRPVYTLPKEDSAKPAGTDIETALLLLDEKRNEDAYIRLNVKMPADAKPADYDRRVKEVLGDADHHNCRFCLINPIRDKIITENTDYQYYSLNEIKEMSSEQIVSIAHKAKILNDEQKNMLKMIIEQVNNENNI